MHDAARASEVQHRGKDDAVTAGEELFKRYVAWRNEQKQAPLALTGSHWKWLVKVCDLVLSDASFRRTLLELGERDYVPFSLRSWLKELEPGDLAGETRLLTVQLASEDEMSSKALLSLVPAGATRVEVLAAYGEIQQRGRYKGEPSPYSLVVFDLEEEAARRLVESLPQLYEVLEEREAVEEQRRPAEEQREGA